MHYLFDTYYIQNLSTNHKNKCFVLYCSNFDSFHQHLKPYEQPLHDHTSASPFLNNLARLIGNNSPYKQKKNNINNLNNIDYFKKFIPLSNQTQQHLLQNTFEKRLEQQSWSFISPSMNFSFPLLFIMNFILNILILYHYVFIKYKLTQKKRKLTIRSMLF